MDIIVQLSYAARALPWRFAEMLARLPPTTRGMMLVINSIKFSEGTSPTISRRCPGIGKGVEEIRVSEPSGAYRVVYAARRAEAVYVLHAFQKKTQATPKKDLEIAKKRLGQLLGDRT